MDSPWENVREASYYRSVLGRMTPGRAAKVRFGTTGEGVMPNYEIEFENGEKVAFSGQSHKPSTTHETFANVNLSRSYSFQEVQSLIQRSSDRTRAKPSPPV